MGAEMENEMGKLRKNICSYLNKSMLFKTVFFIMFLVLILMLKLSEITIIIIKYKIQHFIGKKMKENCLKNP